MRTRTLLRSRGLLAGATAIGLVVAVGIGRQLDAATNPNHSIGLACVASPVNADLTQTVSFSVSGPDAGHPASAVAFTVDAVQATLPAEASGLAVESYSNIRTKVEVYGASVQAAAVTTAGSVAATVEVSGNTVTVVVPGPVAAGATITTPVVTIDATVSASVGDSFGIRPGASPFYRLTANNVALVGTQDVSCNPADATQTANATLTIPVQSAPTTTAADSTGPSISLTSPYDGAIYGFEEPVVAEYTCSDPSGVATCDGTVAAGSPIDTSAPGVYEFEVVAADTKGNTSESTVEYAVLPPGEAPPARPGYEPIVPARVLDTRAEFGTIDGRFHDLGKQGGGSVLEVEVTGRAGAAVDDDAVSVVLNLTATETEGPGHVTVFSCGDVPNASNLNYTEPNDNRPNAVVTRLTADGTVCLHTYGAPTHLVLDVFGYFPPGARYTALEPGRLADTRAGGVTVDGAGGGGGPVQPGSPLVVPVTGRHGVPDGAGAAVFNLTAVNTGGAGFLTVFPCDEDQPWASNVNYVTTGEITPNLVVSRLSGDGEICIDAGVSAADVVVDLVGFFPAVSDYTAFNPGRLLDTRAGGETVDGVATGSGKPAVGEPLVLPVAGRHLVPADADAVVLNVTVTEPDAPGYVTVWSCDVSQPDVSNLNYVRAGQNRPNVVVAELNAAGEVCLVAEPASTHLVVDVAGYFTAPEAPTAEPTPTTTVPATPTTTLPGATTTVPTPTTTAPTTTVPAGAPEAPAACAVFLTQAAAQALYDFLAALGQQGLLAALDPNGNGIVCEDFDFIL